MFSGTEPAPPGANPVMATRTRAAARKACARIESPVEPTPGRRRDMIRRGARPGTRDMGRTRGGRAELYELTPCGARRPGARRSLETLRGEQRTDLDATEESVRLVQVLEHGIGDARQGQDRANRPGSDGLARHAVDDAARFVLGDVPAAGLAHLPHRVGAIAPHAREHHANRVRADALRHRAE